MPGRQTQESRNEQSQQSQSVLLKPEERLRFIEENVVDYAIIVMAPDSQIVNWNVGAERMMGWSEAEVMGQSTSLIFSEEDQLKGVPDQEMRRAEAEGRADNERWHMRKDGSRFWGSGVIMAVRENDGSLRGFMKILRDTTDRRQANEDLRAAYNRERRTAEVLQRSILLGTPVQAYPGLEVSTRYVPATNDLFVGGDFFDTFQVRDNQVALIVGDVAGKGLGAAAQTAQIKFALRVLLREHEQPGTALHHLNKFVLDAERFDSVADDTPTRIVVLSVVIIHVMSGDASISAAGAEPPLILRTTGKAEMVDICNLPIGAREDTEYVVSEAHLEPGDMVLLATDGITESRREQEFLGYDGLVRLARESVRLGSVDRISQAIVDRAYEFGEGFRDDVCLLVARRTE